MGTTITKISSNTPHSSAIPFKVCREPQDNDNPAALNDPNTFNTNLQNLKQIASNIQALNGISWVLLWDSDKNTPKTATESRAWQMGVLAKTIHQILTSPETKYLIEYFKDNSNPSHLNKIDQSLVRDITNQYNMGKNIPSSLLEELNKLTTQAQPIWENAKELDNFSIFIPSLEKIVFIKRQIAEYVGYTGSPYNVLLEAYETGITTEVLDKLFEKLKQELIPIIKAIKNSPQKPDISFLYKTYNRKKQFRFSRELLRHIGFDFTRGRLDRTDTPYSIGISSNDTRTTTFAFNENIYYSIANLLHEGGHSIYFQGIDPKLEKTPLYDGASLGMHESQSRLYETIVGQSLPFWKYYFQKLQKQFPEQLKDVSPEEFYKAINHVIPSFIWSESDEVTYNLQIMLRYEIEKDLIEGRLAVKDIPTIWNKKMQEYLEITPSCDSDGALQVSHWAGGDFGYFPTYTLGNLYAAQIYNQAKKEIPDLEEEIEKGNFLSLKKWLNEKIHFVGRTETPSEIIMRVTGEPLNPDYFIRYVKEKYSKIYNINL